MSDPWDAIRRAADDRRSGSVGVALRAARGLGDLGTRAELRRASRILLRAHPVMAPLWRMLADAWQADDPGGAAAAFAARLEDDSRAAADAIRWVVGRRHVRVVTVSSSSSVAAALERLGARVAHVACAASLPGGEGRRLARSLVRSGLDATVVPDAGIARACGEADLALVGADAITEDGVVNKVGTLPLALAAAQAGIGCYAIASSQKLIPARIIGDPPEPYESTPLALFDAVLTERGARRAPALRRAAGRLEIPRGLGPKR